MQVIVADYNPSWPEQYQHEAGIIGNIIGSKLIEIHHIGSTSIPDMQAKPIIDIMPVVENLSYIDLLTDSMQRNGYEALGEYGIPGRRYFRKRSKTVDVNAHIFSPDNKDDIIRHLAFRDYLVAHKKIADEYGNLKSDLAQKYPDDIESYMDGKNSFVKKTEKKAIIWYVNRRDI